MLLSHNLSEMGRFQYLGLSSKKPITQLMTPKVLQPPWPLGTFALQIPHFESLLQLVVIDRVWLSGGIK